MDIVSRANINSSNKQLIRYTMKRFQEYSLNLKIIIILAGIMLVNTTCFSLLYCMQERGMYFNILAFFILSLTCCCFCYATMKKHIVTSVQNVLDAANDLSVGGVPTIIEYKTGGELGQLSNCINSIIKNKIEVADFVKKIGDGDTGANYELLGNKDIIGSSLVSMRDKLKNISEEDAKRNWTSEGVAIFSDILMEEYSLKVLSEKLLAGLVKYISANQGAFFIREENQKKETVFELYSCYAWDRKKFLNKQIRLNEGLVGQAAIERETIFLTEVPDNYITITSGIGFANPRSILIVPLKVNDVVHGILELASFKVFEKHEIEFIEKLGENIASTISNTKINENTKRLLEDTKAMNENLQAQEEELRQNAEELNATQESLERAKEEMRMQIEELESERVKNEGILEGCVDAVISFNERGKIEFYNKASEELWGINKRKAIGKNIKEFISIRIEGEDDDMILYYTHNNKSEKLDARMEVYINVNDTASSVLINISKVKVGGEYFFTAFIQNIAVELF